MSCLFDSIFKLLKNCGINYTNSHHLRQDVVQYMRMNPNIIINMDKNKKSFTKNTNCDKCDGKHRTKDCPFFKKNREKEIVNLTLKQWITEVAKDMRLSYSNYLRNMSHSSTWGGGLEILVMSKMFNADISVYRRGKLITRFRYSENPEMQFKIHWNGFHYEPMSCIIIN